MTAKQLVQERLPRWSEDDAAVALRAVEDSHQVETNGDASISAECSRDFLISVANGTSGLDLNQLRDVRDRAWR
jgi:hypothetical protein